MDVTNQVRTDFPDDESMPIRKCVCGKEWGYWEQTISIYADAASPMPCCGARLYWQPAWKIVQIETGQKQTGVSVMPWQINGGAYETD